MSVLTLENIWKIYREGTPEEVQALRGINLNIEKGESLAIMGTSGSGKSTILHIMGCLDRPTRGKVIFENSDTSKMDQDERAKIRRKKIGFVFQSFNLIGSLTAFGNVELPMIFSDVDTEERRKTAFSLLESVGLKGREHHKPSELSGGQKQRVAIARALVNNPEIIIADEPTGNLDTKTGNQIMDILSDLKQKGITMIYVTHDKEIAEKAERVIYLKDGMIVNE